MSAYRGHLTRSEGVLEVDLDLEPGFLLGVPLRLPGARALPAAQCGVESSVV
jgi:hypothetical protein